MAFSSNVTARIDAATPKLRPLGVMVGIMVPAALRGSTPEWLGLLAAALVMRFTHKDLVAALAALPMVAADARATG